MLELGTESVIAAFSLNVVCIHHTRIDKKSHRHIRIEGRLLFIKIHVVAYKERHVIVHVHINGIFNGGERDLIGVGII